MSTTHDSPSASPNPSPAWVDEIIGAGPQGKLAVRIYGQRGDSGDGTLAVHFHGGAFVSGSIDSGITVAGLLASAGAVVVSVDYPLAPAHPFPQAIEAGYAALMWAYRARARLAGKRASLFVAGEEAGGNLAAGLALVARDRYLPPLAGQILLSPMLDPCMGTASLRRSEAGPVGCKWADGWCQYLRNAAAADHPYATPGRALRLAGLPPVLLLTAADDPLRDEARAYGRRLQEAGVALAEGVIPAPTGWPSALVGATDGSAPWIGPVRSQLRDFLADPQARPPAR
jgi:acetyl esterase/lipase